MNKRSNYSIIRNDDKAMVLRDDGPWDQHLTVTNDIENVVHDLAGVLHSRSLYYYDSEGDLTQVWYKDGEFVAFGAPQEKAK